MRLTLDNRGIFMDQYQAPCLHHFNDTLMHADGTKTLPQLKENPERERNLEKYVREKEKNPEEKVSAL